MAVLGYGKVDVEREEESRGNTTSQERKCLTSR